SDSLLRARVAADLKLGHRLDADGLIAELVKRRPVCVSMAFDRPPESRQRISWAARPLVWVAGPHLKADRVPPRDFVFAALRLALDHRETWAPPALALYGRAARATHIAVPIGPAPAAESYLNGGKLIDTAQATGCQAIHPGYGFLSERAPFAEAVAQAGLSFVGPPAAAIRAMGDKTEARRRMQAAGVPIVPASTRPVADHVQARAEASRLGYPV